MDSLHSNSADATSSLQKLSLSPQLTGSPLTDTSNSGSFLNGVEGFLSVSSSEIPNNNNTPTDFMSLFGSNSIFQYPSHNASPLSYPPPILPSGSIPMSQLQLSPQSNLGFDLPANGPQSGSPSLGHGLSLASFAPSATGSFPVIPPTHTLGYELLHPPLMGGSSLHPSYNPRAGFQSAMQPSLGSSHAGMSTSGPSITAQPHNGPAVGLSGLLQGGIMQPGASAMLYAQPPFLGQADVRQAATSQDASRGYAGSFSGGVAHGSPGLPHGGQAGLGLGLGLSPSNEQREQQELEEMLRRLNPMAEEYVPPPHESQETGGRGGKVNGQTHGQAHGQGQGRPSSTSSSPHMPGSAGRGRGGGGGGGRDNSPLRRHQSPHHRVPSRGHSPAHRPPHSQQTGSKHQHQQQQQQHHHQQPPPFQLQPGYTGQEKAPEAGPASAGSGNSTAGTGGNEAVSQSLGGSQQDLNSQQYQQNAQQVARNSTQQSPIKQQQQQQSDAAVRSRQGQSPQSSHGSVKGGNQQGAVVGAGGGSNLSPHQQLMLQQLQQQREENRSKATPDAKKRTVYVSDIDQQVTEEQLATLFLACGQVVDCRICGDTNSVLRFAFVEFTDEESANKALELSGTICGCYPLRVQQSKTSIVPVNPNYLPQSEDEREMCARTVYCANIDRKVTQSDVRIFFQSLCGEVSRLRLLGNPQQPTRIAFVEFVQAESAISALNCSGAVLGSLPIRVSPSKTPVRVRGPRQQPHHTRHHSQA